MGHKKLHLSSSTSANSRMGGERPAQERRILTPEDKAEQLLKALRPNGVDKKFVAQGDKIILKEELVVPLKSVMLLRVDFSKINESKENEYKEKWDGLRRAGLSYHLTVQSLGNKVNEMLGNTDPSNPNYIRPGDTVILDTASNKFGIVQLAIKGNNRDVKVVTSYLGQHFVVESTLEEMAKLADPQEYPDIAEGNIRIVNYIQFSYLHIAAKMLTM